MGRGNDCPECVGCGFQRDDRALTQRVWEEVSSAVDNSPPLAKTRGSSAFSKGNLDASRMTLKEAIL